MTETPYEPPPSFDSPVVFGNRSTGIWHTAAFGNQFGGVGIVGVDNQIRDNLISANGNGIFDFLSSGTVIQGNLIGTDVTGQLDLGNATNGVVLSGCSGTVIGGDGPSDGNTISGNDFAGINFFSSNNSLIQGNLIGTDGTGTAIIRNNIAGVTLQDNSQFNEIAENVISGNGSSEGGVSILNSSNNSIKGNLIGTDISGQFDLGNVGDGIRIFNSAGIQIGGVVPGDGNVISGNGSEGIVIGLGDNNVIQGNFIGTNIDGRSVIGNITGSNNFEGIEIDSGSGNLIGGAENGAANIIAGNTNAGIEINSPGNFVEGNFIGTAAKGDVNLGNGSDGIQLFLASSTEVGGNEVAFNGGAGIYAFGGNSNIVVNNTFRGNDFSDIYLSNSGSDVLFNEAKNSPNFGLIVVGSSNNVIGNDVKNNFGVGIYVSGNGNLLESNKSANHGAEGIIVFGGQNQLGNNKSVDNLGFDFSLNGNGFGDLGGNKATSGPIIIPAGGGDFD